jgi:hypothetical protein
MPEMVFEMAGAVTNPTYGTGTPGAAFSSLVISCQEEIFA